MAIRDDATVKLILADYISVDAGNKLNALGVGWTVSGVQANGFTVQQYLAVLVDVPSTYVGQEFALEIDLFDETAGSVAQVPGPLGASGSLEAMRIGQLAKVEPPLAPGAYLPPTMFSRTQALLGFQSGLPLTPGHLYAWRVSIDGEGRRDWVARFLVAGAPPPPVFGGLAGPSDIPNPPALS